jgi:hypothetical protein
LAKTHVVAQGDTIPSIAFLYGFFPDTIWNDPQNAALKTKRETPDVLFPGDAVWVLDPRLKWDAAATDRRYRFRRRGVPARTRFQLFDNEAVLGNVPYTLTVDGKARQGVTDGEGVLEEFIPPNAQTGELRIEPDGPAYALNFGRMDPITETTGVQKRLNNLGFFCGKPDGELNEATKTALREFQERVGLAATGDLDFDTRRQLAAIHDRRSAFPDPCANAGSAA